MGRKRKTPVRIARTLRALRTFNDKTAAVKKAERIEGRARAATAKLELENTRRESRRLEAADFERKEAERKAKAAAREEASKPSFTVSVQPAPVFETTRVDTDGNIISDPLRGRDGEPIKGRPEPVAAPVEAAPVETPFDPTKPPWVHRGELHARDKAEWEAWQASRNPGTARITQDGRTYYAPRPVVGFADPGGVVSQNQNEGRATVKVTGPWPKFRG